MRRATIRRTLVLATLGLTALPLAFLAAAWGYEHAIVGRYTHQLERVSLALGEQLDPTQARAAECEALLVDRNGRVTWDSHTEDAAVSPSLLGGISEWAVERLIPGDPPPERWPAIASAIGAPGARPEVLEALAGERAGARLISPSGQSAIFTLATPRPGGGALFVVKVSRRGVRRLLAVHHDLAKVLLFQAVLSVGLGIWLGRRIVRPIEGLRDAALGYPARPIAEGRLLARADEVGDLARSFSALADALERRRIATAEVGADIAHELKNPLATIAAAAELVSGERPPSDERRRLVGEQIGQSVERLRRAIDRMLGLLRLEVELERERPEPLDYAALVEAVLTEYRTDPRCAGWSFCAEIADGARPVALIASRWRELLRNLIDNALVQPSERREIVVSAALRDEAHVTAVRDFGPGVSPGNRDKIFRRFFTQRPSTAPPGTGLGLSIVVAIAEAHGGRVTLDSPSDGGARFSVTIPRNAATTLPHPVPEESTATP